MSEHPANDTPAATPATIRPLQVDDIPVLAGWIAATPLWQRYGITVAEARTNLQRGQAQGDVMLVADTHVPGGHACGLAWCLRRGMFGRSPYLKLLGIKAAFSGHGIGGALLDAAETALREDGGAMFLLVSDFNSAAQRFYQRQGYRQIGALDAYILPDVAELLYWKRL